MRRSGPDEQEVDECQIGTHQSASLTSTSSALKVFSVAIKQCHRAIPPLQRKVIGPIEGVAVKLIGGSGS